MQAKYLQIFIREHRRAKANHGAASNAQSICTVTKSSQRLPIAPFGSSGSYDPEPGRPPLVRPPKPSCPVTKRLGWAGWAMSSLTWPPAQVLWDGASAQVRLRERRIWGHCWFLCFFVLSPCCRVFCQFLFLHFLHSFLCFPFSFLFVFSCCLLLFLSFPFFLFCFPFPDFGCLLWLKSVVCWCLTWLSDHHNRFSLFFVFPLRFLFFLLFFLKFLFVFFCL